jgi:signal transduction histidine kinase
MSGNGAILDRGREWFVSGHDGAGRALTRYQGGDRRAVARGVALSGRLLVGWAGAGAAAIGVLATTVVLLTPGPTIDFWPVALAFWCTLVLGSGVALVVAWRIGGWARPGQLGTALVALALLVSLLPRFSEILAPIDSLRNIRPLGTTVVILVAVGYVVRSLCRPDVDTAVRPVSELLTLVALMVVGLLAGATVLLLVGDRVLDAIEWSPALACVVGAAATLVAGRHSPRAVTRGVAGVLLLMAVGSLLHHASTADLPQAVAATAMCTSAWLAVGIARDRLRIALAMQDARSLQTLATLGRFSTEMSRERERRHDALNALAAIRSAAEVLTSRGQSLDPATRTELLLAARAELARVERMLAPPATTTPGDVRLSEVLRPLLLARRQRGLVIDADLGAVRVRALPDVVARIVGNLLQNVERHAAGSSVRVVAEEADGVVRLSVSDSGPGIPVQRRPQIFETGVTSHARGQGLGLPSALRLARDQGGNLQLVGSESGCCFVLTLPSAEVAESSSAVRPMHAQAG